MTFEWTRKPVVRKAARISGYVSFGLLLFALSVVWTFPASRLRGYLENRLSQGGVTVKIQDLSIRGFGSVRLTGLKVELPSDRGTNPDGSAYEDLRTLSADRLDLSLGLFSLLLGDLKVKATVYSGEGVLGPVVVVKTAETVTVEIESAQDFPLPSDMPVFGIRFFGKLSVLKGTMT